MKKSKYRKFFVKENDDISVVSMSYFESLSKDDVVNIGVQTFLEIHQQLVRDANAGRTRKLGSIAIVDGLGRSVRALQDRYPFLMHEILSVPRRVAGQRVYVS
jgi:hypothetical protein